MLRGTRPDGQGLHPVELQGSGPPDCWRAASAGLHAKGVPLGEEGVQRAWRRLLQDALLQGVRQAVLPEAEGLGLLQGRVLPRPRPRGRGRPPLAVQGIGNAHSGRSKRLGKSGALGRSQVRRRRRWLPLVQVLQRGGPPVLREERRLGRLPCDLLSRSPPHGREPRHLELHGLGRSYPGHPQGFREREDRALGVDPLQQGRDQLQRDDVLRRRLHAVLCQDRRLGHLPAGVRHRPAQG
mmetsp:Transcript_80358/g.181336  ORF Transcript_80358/g.181336 Transcript_80358/m.181336 type:complete len:239 (-) Transcript_80358:38-754(-)